MNSIKIPAHYNLYNGKNNRELRIDYAIPESGTNEETGIFIFVPGFGGHIDSKVYKKMRDVFADKYNCVTLQCDYFGSKFMQEAEEFTLKGDFSMIRHLFTNNELNHIQLHPEDILNVVSKKYTSIPVIANLNETIDEFADLSFMQVIDIVTAIEAIKILLRENNLLYHERKVIGYGQSHGAYLLHFANRLAPHLFSLVIDNSSWIYPKYIIQNRKIASKINNCEFIMEFDYFAKKFIKDTEPISLFSMYNNFENGSYIYSCIGTTDSLVDVEKKGKIFEKLSNVEFEIIDESKVDRKVFYSTNHGLDADFLKLIDYVFSKNINHLNQNIHQQKYIVKLINLELNVDYSYGLPFFSLIF
ncbi:DUF2920 family protein [Lysinibacillus telephonicus]|uniref:DUF2920 family protein n=1 Tax=Lysinibacillus telephonicus TaxID=1714840 RepID=UPI00163B3341|nr:DUF2920 family protein [Lysinibacillus telephonicus]